MHRQSLGSPASKLHSHGVFFPGAGILKDDIDSNFISEDHRKDKSIASSSSVDVDDEERKPQKSVSISSSSTRLVHLIPFLTFLCFVILYLSSHDPSGTDSIGIDDNIGRGFVEIEKSNVLAIRSMRNLQQQQQQQQQDRRRFHRKFGQ